MMKQERRGKLGTITRRTLLHTGAGGAAALLTACGTPPPATPQPLPAAPVLTTAKRGGTLKVGIQFDPASLDPHGSIFPATERVTEHVYSRLVSLTPDLRPQPDLAESWDISPGGTVYTFRLRRGVRFHDGQQLTAADVHYSFQRILEPATRSQATFYLSRAKTIEAVDDYTLRITLETPNASLLTGLASPVYSIVSKDDASGTVKDLARVTNGTGPFRLVEYVQNTRIVLTRNENYWDMDKPYLDRVEMTPIGDDVTRVTALKQGALDFIENVSGRYVQLLRAESGFVLAGNQNMNIRYLGFNLTKQGAPWVNERVREAIGVALNRQAIVDAAYAGEATPTATVFRPDYWAAYSVPVPTTDPRRARQMLADAGYPNGFPVQIATWAAWNAMASAAQVVRDQLRAIGIAADVTLMDDKELLRTKRSKNYDMTVSGVSGFVDPNDLLYSVFGTGLDSNDSGYNNPEIPRLLADGLAAASLTERRKAYHLLQQTLLNDNPWLPLCSEHRYEAMRSDVGGFTHAATGSLSALVTTFLDR